MLRKFMDFQLSLVEKGKPLHKLKPLITAGDTFLYEPAINTSKGPHIRDAVDAKRWIVMVVFALFPCILMAIWNTGVQKMVFGSGDYKLMEDFIASSTSLSGYFDFAFRDNHFLTIMQLGAMAFFPVLIITYAVGGLCEALFAVVREHEIAEGFLVTGMLFALILPPTIPYWMVAVGVAFGVIVGKELFGGSGMNIMNPALTCRAFLFFSFPNKLSGDVWVGTNPVQIRESLLNMNQTAATSSVDGFSQATPLGLFNIADDVKRVHVDAIATNTLGRDVGTIEVVERQFNQWNAASGSNATLGEMTTSQMQTFLTASPESGGLGLGVENYQAAYEYAGLRYGVGHLNDANFFFGNQLGSMGETSVIACLLGAIFLVWTGVGAWRSMVAMGVGVFVSAFLFQFASETFGVDGGAWNPAKYAFPAYKHLLIGGLAFGMVFMATDPVSSPSMRSAKWLYGIGIGVVVVMIRVINPAFPEGVMLAILLGNVFAPLLDYYAVRKFRRAHRVAIS